MTSASHTPVSPARVLAGALRLSLVPFVDRDRAVAELVDLAHGDPVGLRRAVGLLRRGRGPAPSSRVASATEGLLLDAAAIAALRSVDDRAFAQVA